MIWVVLWLGTLLLADRRGAHTAMGASSATDDTPIRDWKEDRLDRKDLVQQLPTLIIDRHPPILALDGKLGDGKTSVLNLLDIEIRADVIVFRFNAWLPGSESSLAQDLFAGLAAECRKYVFIPSLKKVALQFARTVSGSVTTLGWMREVVPAYSQQDHIKDLPRQRNLWVTDTSNGAAKVRSHRLANPLPWGA